MPRFTIDIDDKFDQTLNDLMKNTDAKTKADVIRRAVASYKYLKTGGNADGELTVTTKDGKVIKNVVLP